MTLIEIMISLVLLGIVSGVMMRVITRQQRFYQGVNQIITQRGQLRQATAVLPLDLRSLSSSGRDIIAVSDSAIVLDVTVGTGVVCEVIATGTQIVLPPEGQASGDMFTSMYGNTTTTMNAMVSKGLWVYVYNDSNKVGNADDEWSKFNLKQVHEDNGKCLSTFAKVGDAGIKRKVLEVVDSIGRIDDAMTGGTGGPVSRYINQGAPVRIVKRVRYKLYQETDNKWYLGFSEYDKSTDTFLELSPVSGPFQAYAGSGSTGIAFKFYDVDGTEITSGTTLASNKARMEAIARVELVARAKTASNVRAAGIQNGVSQQYQDSLAASVMIRNRQ